MGKEERRQTSSRRRRMTMDGVGSGYSGDAAGHGQMSRREHGKPGAAMVRAGCVGPGTVAARHRDPGEAHEIDARRRWVAPAAAQHAQHSVPQRRGGCSATRAWRRKMRLNCTEERDARGSDGWFNGEEEQRGGQGLEWPRVRTTCVTWAQLAAGNAAAARRASWRMRAWRSTCGHAAGPESRRLGTRRAGGWKRGCCAAWR
jgi:hypothetical protein